MGAKRKERFSVVIGAVDKISAPIRRMNRKIESISAPINKLKRKMRSLTREAGFGKLGGAIGNVGKQLAKLGAVGALAFAGLFRSLARTAETMDTLAKTTRALDFPVDEFQRWKQVAQIAGVGAESFDKSIQKLSKNIGELRLNTGTMSTILDKASPAFKKQLQNSKSNAEAFDLVIKKMRSLKNAQDRAALAQAAFGRAGKELINVANLSEGELSKLRAQVSGNGGIISASALANAEAFQDSLLLMKTAVGNVWSEISGRLFPVVVRIMDGIREWTTTHKELVTSGVTAFLEEFIAGGVKLFGFMRKWIPPTIELVKRFGGMKLVLGVLAAAIFIPLAAAVLSVGAAFASTAGLVTLAVGGIVAAIAIVVAKWEGLKALFIDSGIGGFISDSFQALGGAGSLQAASAASAQFAPGAVTPQGAAAAMALKIRVDQEARITGVEPDEGSAVSLEVEGVANEAF